MTFTGKAASVLRKKGNEEAQTAHSAMYIMEGDEAEGEAPAADEGPLFGGAGAPPKVKRDPGELNFTLNRFGVCADADLLAYDECSMMDEVMSLDGLSFGKKVLVMGDPGQLPPVRGAGYFQKLEPDAFLTEVHRQALESPILRLSIMAREGKQIPFGSVDNGDAGMAQIVKLTRDTEHLVLRKDTQPICGVHRVRKTVTSKIRHSRGFGGFDPMGGETIICGKNNRDRNLFNGLQGELLKAPTPYRRKAGDDEVYNGYQRFEVMMEDHDDALEVTADPWMFADHFQPTEQPRMRKGIEWFDWGYVLTCHKSQGSEWPDVSVVDDSGSFREDRHRWLYTAITRASDRLTILRR